MRQSVVLIAVAALVAMVAALLFVHGTDVEGLRVAIRATARTSALCAALAFARIRVRECSAILPVSHALHYALVFASGREPDWRAYVLGGSLFAVMLWNAVRPNAAALYILWISFIIGFLRPGAIYVVFIAALLFCGVLRWFPRTRATIA
jgi:hypothetical protein